MKILKIDKYTLVSGYKVIDDTGAEFNVDGTEAVHECENRNDAIDKFTDWVKGMIEMGGNSENRLDLMIDIETLSIKKNALFFEIGWCSFEMGNIDNRQSGVFKVDIMNSLMAGSVVDQETVEWWRSQDNRPKMQAYDATPEKKALEQLIVLCGQHEFFWANSPKFDLIHLEAGFDRHGLKAPWAHYQEMDQRTIKKLARRMGWDMPDQAITTHNAQQDAVDQAIWVSQMIDMMNERLKEPE